MDGAKGDTVEQFHRNEAISAVADDGFVEEEDDYEDLYNDVNVGEGFLHSLRKNEDLGFRNEVETSRTSPLIQNQPPRPPTMSESIPGVGERKIDGDVGTGASMGKVDVGYPSQEAQPPVRPNGGMSSGPVGGTSGMACGYGGNSGGGLRVELGQNSSKVGSLDEQAVVNSVPGQGMGQPAPPHGINVGGVGAEGIARQGVPGGNVNGTGGNMGASRSSAVQVTPGAGGSAGVGSGGTILFVGDLHWWTTDAELEAELVKYGPVKELKFFDEKASGKSKGYCQVEFYDPIAASACKEGMHGYVFNGRPCVVAFASPYNIKRMGEAQVNRNQPTTQQNLSQTRRPNDPVVNKPVGNNISTGGNYQGGDQNRNFGGRGNWRGNPQGMGGGRGPVGPIRNRPVGMSGGRGMMMNGGNGFGQGGMGPNPPLMHPQAMMGQGFDPGFGPMGRMGNYGGFPGGPTPPYQGMLSSFPPVGNVGLPGVAPHVNPAFFGRGMPMNGMGGMMPNGGGVDGPSMGMWSDTNMAGWPGDEHGGRAGESSYGEEAVSDHQYGEASHDRSGWQNPMKEKDRPSEREFSGSSDRRYRDEREPGYDRDMLREKDAGHDQEWPEKRHRDEREARDHERSRDRDRERSRDHDRERSRDRERERDKDRYREDRERNVDHHKYRDREANYDEEWDRGRSSRTHGKSRISHEEERSRSRDADYGKRRRITSE